MHQFIYTLLGILCGHLASTMPNLVKLYTTITKLQHFKHLKIGKNFTLTFISYRWSFLTFTATNKGSSGQVVSEISDKVRSYSIVYAIAVYVLNNKEAFTLSISVGCKV